MYYLITTSSVSSKGVVSKSVLEGRLEWVEDLIFVSRKSSFDGRREVLK
jgi:hypothetical protein